MQLNIMYRKALYVFLSLMIVISSTQTAYAATSWSLQSAAMQGATATISALKGGYSSLINHRPTAAAVGKELVKGGGALALAYAMSKILDAGIDWVLDPANNRVVYDDPKVSGWVGTYLNVTYYNAEDFCKAWNANRSSPIDPLVPVFFQITPTRAQFRCDSSDGNYATISASPDVQTTTKSIPIDTVASSVISNADTGHASSQELIKTVAIQDFNAGVLDNSLEQAKTDTDNPTTDPNDPTSPSFDPSSIISALQSLMSAINNMSASLKAKLETMTTVLSDKIDEMIGKQTETNQVINDGMADVVAANQATEAKVGEVVAAIEGLEGNTLDGQVINDAIDKAIAAGHSDTASIVAAIEGLEGNTLDGQVINDAVDRVITNDNTNAQATQDVISNSIDDVIAESHVDADTVADAVTDSATATQEAIQEQTDALTKTNPDTGETSLALPSFCGWAGTVCEYMDWVKGEYQTTMDWFKTEPAPPPTEPVAVIDDVDIGNWQEKANAGYVQFGGQCPTDVNIPINYMGASTNLSISYAPFCQFASMIKPAVILGAWISAMLIISGGRARES